MCVEGSLGGATHAGVQSLYLSEPCCAMKAIDYVICHQSVQFNTLCDWAADALALAGVDYLVLNERIVDALDKATTLQGYNDGFRADENDQSGVEQQLSSDSAQQVEFGSSETVEVTRQLFEEGLGMAGLELLDNGIRNLVEDVNRLEPVFQNLAIDSL